jgi:hypothetical protein
MRSSPSQKCIESNVTRYAGVFFSSLICLPFSEECAKIVCREDENIHSGPGI